jgi:tetratricopeptide (TPR) repeat protein
MLLRWRAPELALLLADRAVTAAQDDKMARLQADHLAVFALNRLSRYGEAAHRLFPAIQDADTPSGLRHELHVELAHCAAALGEPATALGAVRAVLAAGEDVAPALRGRALVAVAEAAVALGRDDLVTSALEEAEELYREDSSLDHDTALLLRAAVRATDAARHRARGRTDEAEAKAREGRELLAGLVDPGHDSGEVSARLMLELTLTLLDRGAGETATQDVRPLLQRQVRAAGAGAVGRLRLALATQVHLAEGRHEPALTLLADAVEGAQRYGVDAVLAECLEGLSHVHEARDEFADALHCMRAARAAEGRHCREVAAARSILLENYGSARREEACLVGQVAELLANAGAGSAGGDADPGPLHSESMAESSAHRSAVPEVPQVRVAEADEREAEPADADVPEAEVGEVEEQNSVVQDADSPGGPDSWQSRARHRHGAAEALVSVSDLLPASALSAGRSGRRRAEEPVGKSADETSAVEVHQGTDDGPQEGSEDRQQGVAVLDPPATPEGEATGGAPAEGAERIPATRQEFPVSGPPPAPTPRELEWEGVDEDSAEHDEASQMGLGDLLAEALAAYQESRGVHADVEIIRDLPRYRGSGTRWTAGLALAPNLSEQNVSGSDLGEAAKGESSGEITSPLLRLPDLTAEPRWFPPEIGRRSAAGD